MAMSYECWAYKNGKPYKMIRVSANSKSEAEMLAWEKFRSMGIEPESVNCKWKKDKGWKANLATEKIKVKMDQKSQAESIEGKSKAAMVQKSGDLVSKF